MTIARREQIDLAVTPYYHCITRCVRRAFLCGKDASSGRDFGHRKEWIRTRMRKLTSIFAIDVCAYAIMSNHVHLVLRVDHVRASSWTDEEVIRRHTAFFPSTQEQVPDTLPADKREELVSLWRTRLHDIGWFMRGLNQYIACRANKEDGVTGHFWQARFKSQALLDVRGLIACMVYVDLNPVRAGVASSLEESNFTSIQERILEHHKNRRRTPKGIAALQRQSKGGEEGTLPISFVDYVELVEWTGNLLSRQLKRRAREPRALSAHGASARGWERAQRLGAIETATALGSLDSLHRLVRLRGKRTMRGIGVARCMAA